MTNHNHDSTESNGTTYPPGVNVERVSANGIDVNVAVAGQGTPVLLLHGWPHTWRLWSDVIPRLATAHRVIAPDLRGLGASTRTVDSYDLHTLADDASALLNALGEPRAAIVGIDAGAPPAFMLAMRKPGQVRKLVLMESLLGTLPGAESFLAGGPPWWFGFHAVPNLAETVLVGHEREYIKWFLTSGTAAGNNVRDDITEAFIAAYQGREALRCSFEYYRAAPNNARQINAVVESSRLKVPTMAISGGFVGKALQQQLEPIADDLVGQMVPNCRHLIPLEQPEALVHLLTGFLA